MEWRAYKYGDVIAVTVEPDPHGVPPRALFDLGDGSFLFIEYVKDSEVDEFLSRGVSMEARVLAVKKDDGRGSRTRTLASVLESSREETISDMPEPRTALWCLFHLEHEGRNLEAHFEHFKSLCGVQANQWGMEEYMSIISFLKAFLFRDQLDPANLLGIELMFRRLQTIEYSYSDKLREKMAASSGGKLTMDEQAAFGAAARLETRLMICPKLVEKAKDETEKEAGLAKSLLKAREARAALAKK